MARDCPKPRKHSGGGDLGPEWFKPPDSNQPGCIKVSSDPNHRKKKIDGAEVWWCGKCFTKKNNSIGRWTDTNKRHFTSEHCGGGGPRTRGGRLPNQPPTAPTANLGGAVVDPITSGSEQPAPSGDSDPQQSVTFSEALAGTIPR